MFIKKQDLKNLINGLEIQNKDLTRFGDGHEKASSDILDFINKMEEYDRDAFLIDKSEEKTIKKVGDSFDWLDGTKVTVRNVRRGEEDVEFYLFHEIPHEWSGDSLRFLKLI